MADYNLTGRDSAGTEVGTPASVDATNADLDIADSTAVAKDSAGTTLSTTSILAEGSSDITIGDSTVVLMESDGTTPIRSVTVKASSSVNDTVGESTVNVNKSDSVLISAVTVEAEGLNSYNVADSPVTINSVDVGAVKATDTKALEVVNASDGVTQIGSLNGGTGRWEVTTTGGGTVEIRDEDANLLYSVTPAGTVTQVINNNVLSINTVAWMETLAEEALDTDLLCLDTNGAGSPIGTDHVITPTVLSDGLIYIGQTIVTMKNSSGSTIKVYYIPAGESEEYVVGDASVVVKNSAGTTIESVAVPAGGYSEPVITDSALTVNGVAYVDVPAEVGYDIVVKDTDGTPVGTINVSDEIIVPAAGGGGSVTGDTYFPMYSGFLTPTASTWIGLNSSDGFNDADFSDSYGTGALPDLTGINFPVGFTTYEPITVENCLITGYTQGTGAQTIKLSIILRTHTIDANGNSTGSTDTEFFTSASLDFTGGNYFRKVISISTAVATNCELIPSILSTVAIDNLTITLTKV